MKVRTSFPLLMLGAMLSSLGACSSNDHTPGAETTSPATLSATQSSTALTFSQVSAGGNLHYANSDDWSAHTCAISSGTLWCWGSNSLGQLGTGDYVSTSTPVQVGTETDWIYVEAGGSRTCGIRGSSGKGTLWCWGSNRRFSHADFAETLWGLLGLGATYDTTDAVNAPTQVGTGADWVQVGMANHHSCGIRDDGTDRTLYCWGADALGALGDGSSGDTDVSNEPIQEAGGYTDWAYVTASKLGVVSSVTCGIREDTGSGDRTIWCMGYEDDSDGFGDITGGDTPFLVGSGTDWLTVALSGTHTYCAINNVGAGGTQGELYCAQGSGNDHGQAGQGDYSDHDFLEQIGSDDTWTNVSVGRQSVCGVNDGVLYCWGRNHVGELGLGADPSASHIECDDVDNDHGYVGNFDCNAPVKVDGAQTWVATTGGRSQSCALTDADEVYCWGHNIYGAVGVEEGPVVYFPTKVE